MADKPKPGDTTPPAAPTTDKPKSTAQQVEGAAKAVSATAILLAALGALYRVFESGEGPKTMGKAAGNTLRTGGVVVKHASDRRGLLAKNLRKHEKSIAKFGRDRARDQKREDQMRFWQLLFLPLRLFLPLPLWATTRATNRREPQGRRNFFARLKWRMFG